MTEKPILPVWAHRIRKADIQRLYQSCASGLDAEVIEDVGFGLLLRCRSILRVAEAIRGRPFCPVCQAQGRVRDMWTDRATAVCDACGWQCPFPLYQKTYKRKGLFAGGMEPFVQEFVDKFEATHDPGQRLILIDTIIHRFHWETGDGQATGRPGATGLIEGKMSDITAFLDRLTYGENVPADIAARREKWRNKWRRNPWSHGRGQPVKKRTAAHDAATTKGT